MKLPRKADIIFDRILDVLALLAAFLVVFMMLAVGAEILLRYLTHYMMLWVIEVSEYALLYIAFLGAAWLLRKDGHVKMDFILNRLTPRAQARLNVITSVVGTIMCLVVTWYGVKATLEYFELGSYQLTPLAPPTFIIVAVIPLGSFLLFIQFLRRAYQYSKSSEPSSAKE